MIVCTVTVGQDTYTALFASTGAAVLDAMDRYAGTASARMGIVVMVCP